MTPTAQPAPDDIDAAAAAIRALASGHPQAELIHTAAELLIKHRTVYVRDNSLERDNGLIYVFREHLAPRRFSPSEAAKEINKMMNEIDRTVVYDENDEPKRTIARILDVNGGKPLAIETIRKKIATVQRTILDDIDVVPKPLGG